VTDLKGGHHPYRDLSDEFTLLAVPGEGVAGVARVLSPGIGECRLRGGPLRRFPRTSSLAFDARLSPSPGSCFLLVLDMLLPGEGDSRAPRTPPQAAFSYTWGQKKRSDYSLRS
jgi:hypothetical protein